MVSIENRTASDIKLIITPKRYKPKIRQVNLKPLGHFNFQGEDVDEIIIGE